ncbi:WhiB family transcriptional regulator [Nocardia brasiliensis]|uniref:WhiB family transcriptional regulator n=1 Tax=Nocardia brasiliensis TaxID=37326 RepID=UPI00366B041D
MSWRSYAKCAGDDPAKYEVANLPRGREHETANALCEGCPVRSRCLREALMPLNMSKLLGVWERPDVIGQSGVVRGGVPLGLGQRRVPRPSVVAAEGVSESAESSPVAVRCSDCHRPMRHRSEPPKPGTVLANAGGRCGNCYRKQRERCGIEPRTAYTHCTKCGREFGSQGRYGGTVRIGRASTGTCRSCLWLERDARRRARSCRP